jgi:transglutaminase-like putative cysteine protease
MRYTVHHETRYVYEEAVAQCFNELHLTPRDLPGQRVLKTDIRISPHPSVFVHRMDYFGNSVTGAEILERHKYFEAVADSVVEVDSKLSLKKSAYSWEEVRNLLVGHESDEALQASEFVYASRYAP